jgi:hypothetical protein
MNKYLTYIIGISCIVITGSVAYYFLSYLPNKNILIGQKECHSMALKRFENDKAELPASSLTQPEFVFDNGRCLYKMHEMNTTGSKTFEQFYILDLYTNNQVVGYGTKLDEGQLMVTSGDKIEFETLNDKYFSK